MRQLGALVHFVVVRDQADNQPFAEDSDGLKRAVVGTEWVAAAPKDLECIVGQR